MIIILHGALGSAAQLQPLTSAFTARGWNVQTLNFPGHGGEPVPEEGYSIALFSDFLQRQIETISAGEPIHIFGYSMGGYVAAYLEALTPGRISSLVTLGTKWEWSPESASREVKMLDAAKIREKVPAFAKILEQRHGPGWEQVLQHTAQMMIHMGENPPVLPATFEAIGIPVEIWRGTADTMVSEEESRQAHALIRGSVYREWENMPHPIEKCDPELLADAVERFMNGLT